MKSAEEVLHNIISIFIQYLNELSDKEVIQNDFILGEKTAYVECLELIQEWSLARKYGLKRELNISKQYL